MIRAIVIVFSIILSFIATILAPPGAHGEEKEYPFPPRQERLPFKQIHAYEVLRTYPHDSEAFTQGLVFHNGVLYEGTGLFGKSSLRKVELDSGKILQVIRLPDAFFGEGIAVYQDRIIQLTWKSASGFVYDRDSFDLVHIFKYPHEGWGITHDGERLIVSDGTSIIRFWDAKTFKEIGRIKVFDEKGPVENLNELEYIKCEIYANIWKTNRIAKISPNTGKVTGWIDLEGLFEPEGPVRSVNMLNGIAYDSKKDRLFVTGKLWPFLFEIRLVEP